MNAAETATARPGIALFAAILNFVSALISLVVTAILALILIAGIAARLTQNASGAVQGWPSQVPINAAFIAIGCGLMAVAFLCALFFLFLGIGLLRGSSTSWYLQAVLSVLGLFFIPFGTVLSILILALFFQKKTRAYFKIG